MIDTVDARWLTYYRVCLDNPAALRSLERQLTTRTRSSQGATGFTVSSIAHELAGNGVSHDFIALAIEALAEVGCVTRRPNMRYSIDKESWDASELTRDTIKKVLAWIDQRRDDTECELMLGVPVDAASITNTTYDRHFLDLRTSVRAMIAQSHSRLILASPYWDTDVANDLGELLIRRCDAGVKATILARLPRKGDQTAEALRSFAQLGGTRPMDVRILEKRQAEDRFGSSTFHFKAAAADRSLAYIGSANFNSAGMQSRWELGVMLRGLRAQIVSELLEALLLASRPYTEVLL